MQPKENLVEIIRVLYKRRKQIILLSILTAVAVAGISLLLPNWYQASSTFYVASPDLAKPSPLGLANSEVKYYGEGEDIDRILTIAGSSQLANDLIDHFDLMAHYKIDKDHPKARVQVLKKFKKNFKVIKTQYEALNISFECTNPILSRDVTNVARDKINEIGQKIIKDSQANQLKMFEKNIREKKIALNTLNSSIDSLRTRFSIFDTRQQGQVITSLLTKSQSKLNNSKAKLKLYSSYSAYRDSVRILKANIAAYQAEVSSLKKQAENFNKGISGVTGLQKEAEEAATQLALDSERYKLLKSKFESPFDAIHVIEFANKPVEKSRPKRSLLVIGAGIFAFLFLCFIALVLEFFKSVDWKTVLND